MRYFLISILFILMISCSQSTTKGFLELEPDKNKVINEYFSDLEKDYIYKAKLNIYDNNFGGILIIKKIKENHHRVVFTTEFGNKIFDFEFIEGSFQVNYMINKLDKKLVINILRNDFNLLVNENNNVVKQFFLEEEYIYQSKLNNQKNYYFYSKKNNILTKVVKTSKDKTTIFYNKIENNVAKDIVIIHQKFKIKINLTYLSN